MKKSLIYWFGFLLTLLFLSMALNSCKAKKPLKEIEKEVKETKKENFESDKTVINQEILDKIILQIPQIFSSKAECDSLINYYRLELAKSIESSKSSGDNSYLIKFNEQLNQLEILMKIAKTENKEIIIHTTDTTTYTLQKTKEVPVHFMNWWEKMFMRVGMTCMAIGVSFLAFAIIKRKVS